MNEPMRIDHLRLDENSVDRGHNIILVWGQQVDVDKATMEERMGLTWELTVEEWAKKGVDVRNQRLRRDICGIIKRKANSLPDN